MTRLIAFSGAIGSGKSVAAGVLVEEFGYVDVKFADPLKNMLRAFYATCGLTRDAIEQRVEGALKEVECFWLMGRTPRFAMQTLGTEWRDMIDRDLWTQVFRKRVESGKFGPRIVCSDYRFPHEGVVLQDMGALAFVIERARTPGTGPAHASELYFDQLWRTGTLANDGTLERFRNSIRSIGNLRQQAA